MAFGSALTFAVSRLSLNGVGTACPIELGVDAACVDDVARRTLEPLAGGEEVHSCP